MQINIKPKTTRINLLTEKEQEQNGGTCSVAFTTLMDSLSKMVLEAKMSAFTYPPMPRFEYNKTIYSELVDILNDEQKAMLEDVGIEFRKQAGSFTCVYMHFTAES